MTIYHYSKPSALIRKILGDFLGLAARFRVQFRVKNRREQAEYSGSQVHSELWRDVLGPYYGGPLESKKAASVNVGDVIALKNIHLSSFISRAPGLFHSSGYQIWWNAWDDKRYPFLGRPVSQNANLILSTSRLEATKIAESVTGLKCQPDSVALLKRSTRKNNIPFYFYSVLYNIGLRTVCVYIDAQSGDVLRHYDSSRLDDAFKTSRQSAHERVKSGARGVVRFGEHENKVLLSAYASTVDLGFPVIVSKSAYSKIRNLINRYASVHMEELKGTVVNIPGSFLRSEVGRPILEWGSGVPQVGLIIDTQHQMRRPGTPDDRKNFASAWNLGRSKEFLMYDYRIFRIGVEDYEHRIRNAVGLIEYELKTLNTKPLFDFDEVRTRFPEAIYGPNYFIKRLEIETRSPEKLLSQEKPFILISALREEKEALEAKADKLKVFAREEMKDGTIKLSSRRSKVVAVTKAIGRTGNRYSREALGEVVGIHNPKLVVLYGIAAGIHPRVEIGDVVIADKVWDLRKCEISGDENDPKFTFEPEQLNSPRFFPLPIQISELRMMLRNEFKRKVDIHTDLLCGSSDNLIRNRAYMEAASRTNRKLGAIEMEAAGIAEICKSFNIPFIIVKAISDFGYDKTDTHHRLCCQMAASCVLNEFLLVP